MKKEICSFRQINAAQDELNRKAYAFKMEWQKKNPCPTYEENMAWQLKHPNPQQVWDKKAKEFYRVYEEKIKDIIYKAKAEIITPAELIKCVEKF